MAICTRRGAGSRRVGAPAYAVRIAYRMQSHRSHRETAKSQLMATAGFRFGVSDVYGLFGIRFGRRRFTD